MRKIIIITIDVYYVEFAYKASLTQICMPKNQHLVEHRISQFIIDPSYSADVYLIWQCDRAVHITYLISLSSSLSYYAVTENILIWMYKKYKTTLVC